MLFMSSKQERALLSEPDFSKIVLSSDHKFILL